MLHYFIRRMNLLIITFLVINLIAFLFQPTHDANLSPNLWLAEYWRFVGANLRGDLGISVVSGKPVAEEVLRYLPATLELCIVAFAISFVVGVPIGTLAGVYQQRPLGKFINAGTLITQSIPVFWLPLPLMMSVVSLQGWFPISGRYDLLLEIPQHTGFAMLDVFWLPETQRWPAMYSVLSHIVLPGIVLSVIPTTELVRHLTTSTAKVMEQNYVKAAATMGKSKLSIVLRHVLHNALPPILPGLGLQFGSVLTAAMVLEMVFAWPGIGRWLINSIYFEDYVAIQGGMLVIATLVITTFVVTDLFTALIHPLRRREVYALR